MPKIYRAMAVYVKNSQGTLTELYDTSGAEHFGILQKPIFTFFNKNITEKDVCERLSEGLLDFSPDDCFLVMGDMEVCGMAIGMILMKLGRIKILKWNKALREYRVRDYDLTTGQYYLK